jgi:uncharacterized RDD family membrane protein YckC
LKQGASLKKRLSALLFEYFTILGFMAVLFGISMFVYFVVLDGIPLFGELGLNLLGLALVVPVVLFSIITEASKAHATWGKRKMKLMVVSKKTDTVCLWQIVVRNIIKFTPWQLAHMAIFHSAILQWEFTAGWTAIMIAVDVLPFIWVLSLFRKDHRGIHDLIAGTVVVETV